MDKADLLNTNSDNLKYILKAKKGVDKGGLDKYIIMIIKYEIIHGVASPAATDFIKNGAATDEKGYKKVLSVIGKKDKDVGVAFTYVYFNLAKAQVAKFDSAKILETLGEAGAALISGTFDLEQQMKKLDKAKKSAEEAFYFLPTSGEGDIRYYPP